MSRATPNQTACRATAQQGTAKRNISIDLNRERGVRLVLRLCVKLIIVENFRAGTPGRWP